MHAPQHVETFAELGPENVDLVAEAWQRRARDAGGNCFPFLNEGAAAGASQPHSHSQLAWLPAPLATAGRLPDVVPSSSVTVSSPVAPSPGGARTRLWSRRVPAATGAVSRAICSGPPCGWSRS